MSLSLESATLDGVTITGIFLGAVPLRRFSDVVKVPIMGIQNLISMDKI